VRCIVAYTDWQHYIKLPAYSSADKTRIKLLKAIEESHFAFEKIRPQINRISFFPHRIPQRF
jgi:hypothetical protein